MDRPATGSRGLLVAEFAALYVGLPLALALVLPPDWFWPLLFAVTLVALGLLAVTPGFTWGELARGWRGLDRRAIGTVAAITAATAAALVWTLVPGQALALPRRAPELWLMVLVLYPLLSALPQEILFRLLFFRRYGALFPGRRAGVLASAATFSLAHLMFWNWVALVLTFAGGAIFASAFLGRGGFALAVVLHAVCGWILFTSGLGVFFYHGAIDR